MIHSGIYLLHFMNAYLYMRKNNKPVRSENLTSGQIVFKKGLIWFFHPEMMFPYFNPKLQFLGDSALGLLESTTKN